ncbi:MAG: cadherin-like beta sandwich domain-containing protein [Bacilli bacterium]|nr:cadherin-like beta sandwich domain-containing protein [Bacilli bacterium]
MNKNKLIKSILLTIITISILAFNINTAYAVDYGRISSTTGVKLRKNAGTSYDKVITVPHNAIVTVNEQNVPTNDSSTGCSTGYWHKITYGEYSGYACSRYVEITGSSSDNEIETPTSNMATMTDAEFETYLTNQGFPESYKVKLRELHKSHPNWVFVGVKTRDNWSDALKNENVSGRSLYQSTSSSTQGYLNTGDGYYNWYKDKFTAKDGSTWFQANTKTIEYYMDPRNFLNESGIFMFEDLNYYSSYQTSTAVKAILYTDFYNDLIPYYMEAANSYNVSPIYLAALTRQEVGLSSGYATSGTTKTYCSTDYTGYYNFYNIQATAGTKPVCNGLAYAVKKGWNTKQKAIVGGASWIVSGYIDAGQNTAYFQKWNTSKNATKPYYHQYMSNIRAVASSASTTKSSYNSMGILDYPFVFQIPIYEGIPSSTSLPATGNPNNWLKTLTINGTSVTNFDAEETKYTVNVPAGTKSVSLGATTINSNAKTTGTGTINLNDLTTIVNIIVTAQNGTTRTYTVTINRPEEIIEEETDKPDEKEEEDNTNDNVGDNDNTTENEKDENQENNNSNEPTTYPTVKETITASGYNVKENMYLSNFTLGSTVQGTITKLQNANKYASINITNSSNKAKTSGSIVTGDKITIISNNETITYTVIIYGDNNADGKITILDLANVQKHLLKKSTLTGANLKATDTNKDGKITILDLANFQKQLLKKSNISQS